ncbi:HAMP domain-containing histidine kinase [Caldibacillus lycopersici]|uniref:histidine kinase n=1 Tax=Perspicuibacillus lycopersici TaxID=1325689 RepID=A0AAE3IYN9_9BACI|nr:HAMP domain-containing sensor histidine kinase [Perspicuibacillus lycopersici]MCU9614475.1 HAMP domain-containing histidine kinase [Perspicuibacillus lycopersici]
MFTRNKGKKIPLHKYWTTRYLLTLVIGLVVIAIISALWIRHNTLENRLNMMEFMAEEIAHRIVNLDENMVGPENGGPGLLENRGQFLDMETNPKMYIVNTEGTILLSNRPRGPLEAKINEAIIANTAEVQKLQMKEDTGHTYVVKKPIEADETVIGYVIVTASEKNLAKVNQEYRQLSIMIIGLAILGWAAIYFLSKRLSKPIKDVAKAARQVQQGNYHIDLPDDWKEAEVDELIHSFKEMSQQLQRLESLRTELLAGVTHELKTPVTSISGLLQAVNDEVVTGDEAKEFLEISLKETAKMRKMVEDLLAFNTFAANAIPIKNERHSIIELVQDFIHQWKILQGNEKLNVKLSLLPESVEVFVDPIRLQQIFTNLLNNAMQAMDDNGEIDITIRIIQNEVFIDVRDTGGGIRKEEQSLIFERFYRGENKKYKIRGLGLGLPFSKMIAQSLGGDLVLIESSEKGSTFRITLPIAKL